MQKLSYKKKIDISTNRPIKQLLRKHNVNTVCENALCPNITECFTKNTVTFMILGNICTRNCKFCNVTKKEPLPVDNNEPKNIAKVIQDLKLDYVVITSVTRDDLPDKGALHFANVINEIKKLNIGIEVLTPDFSTHIESLKIVKQRLEQVINSGINVFAHNIEMPKILYSNIRSNSNYETSINVLKLAKKINNKIYIKSGLMLGLGETKNEVIETMKDIYTTGCDIITLGQYFSPSLKHVPVKKYISNEKFEEFRQIAYNIGFKYVMSGTHVRSSYKAKDIYISLSKN